MDIDTRQLINKGLRIRPEDSLTLRSSSFFFDAAVPLETELQLLEKTMEALEKNQRLSKKQLKETREAMQKTLKEARENRKQQLQNVRSQVYVNQSQAFADEFVKLDSTIRKRNEWLMEVQLENVENAVKVLENITIIRPDGITSVRRFPEDADYFIDGKAASSSDVKKISPQQIKSVEIQKKDNKRGVIRITTKQGKD